jgi:hypothetical protein
MISRFFHRPADLRGGPVDLIHAGLASMRVLPIAQYLRSRP